MEDLIKEADRYRRMYNVVMAKIEVLIDKDLALFDEFTSKKGISVLPNLYLWCGKEITQETVFKMFEEWKKIK